MEVVSLVGGALLSATFNLLLKKLNGTLIHQLLNLKKDVRAQMEEWNCLLPKFIALLEDAEEKQVTNRSVKLWLADLRDLAYDMEDMLEEFEIDAKRSKLTTKSHTSTSKVQDVSSHWFKGFRFMPHRQINCRVKGITDRLEQIEKQMNRLGLTNLTLKADDKSRKVAAEKLLDSSLLEDRVWGRESDKDAILKMLLEDGGNLKQDFVIPIVGMGGVGKTTLVRLIYNDERLEGKFELKAWVCVSDEFDVIRITRTILQQITGERCDIEDLTFLQERLKRTLSGHKFLLVLDDVWNEKYGLWDILQRPFISGAPGSRIIVTTRNKDVGKMMRGDHNGIYCVRLLPDDACLSLFTRHALAAENFDRHPNLKDVGEELVRRCKGLPLAVKTIGGLLRGKPHRDEWEDILNSKIWGLPENRSGILPALRLSYNHLPSHLKRCFAYCALFPKDYKFKRQKLILLWMAEGLLQQQSLGKKRMEVIGDQYFNDLLSRSLFQRSNEDESGFGMHDLIHDLALDVAGEIYCNLEGIKDDEKIEVNFEKTRHLSFFPCFFEISKRFEFLDKFKNVRTFLPLQTFLGFNSLSNRVLHDFLPNLKQLRVLSLCGYRIRKLPDAIENLKHLRYIDLSGTLIECVPESVGSLLFLQTLLLCYCGRLTELPLTIGNLVDLHHLDITGTPSLKKMPSGIANLTNLQTLPKFIVGNNEGLKLKDLKNLPHLQGQLSILDLCNVLDVEDAREANLSEIKGLDYLLLEWSSEFHNSENENKEMQVLGWLKPHQNLKGLEINGYCGLQFPSWIGDPSFSKLEFLKLRNCQKCTSLPSLGQLPLLKELSIIGMHASDGGNFSTIDCFPLLEQLVLQDCPLVEKLPRFLPSLKKLEIMKCPLLTDSLVSLPSLEELCIEDCNEIVLRSMVNNLTSLTTLKIGKISNLTHLPKSFVESIKAIKHMAITRCEELTSLWEEDNDEITKLRLEEISISDCPSLKSFQSGNLPTTLKRLRVEKCKNLESLPEGLMNVGNSNNMPHLEELDAHGLASLNSFPNGHLPASLKHLDISYCGKLESIPDMMLRNCTTLKAMCISGCSNLKSLPLDYFNFSSLTSLFIADCEGLECFPERELPFPQLNTLELINCKNLKSLPNWMHNLTSPSCLRISGCPGIVSIPDSGFPPNIAIMHIDCVNLKQPMQDWGLLSRPAN